MQFNNRVGLALPGPMLGCNDSLESRQYVDDLGPKGDVLGDCHFDKRDEDTHTALLVGDDDDAAAAGSQHNSYRRSLFAGTALSTVSSARNLLLDLNIMAAGFESTRVLLPPPSPSPPPPLPRVPPAGSALDSPPSTTCSHDWPAACHRVGACDSLEVREGGGRGQGLARLACGASRSQSESSGGRLTPRASGGGVLMGTIGASWEFMGILFSGDKVICGTAMKEDNGGYVSVAMRW